MKKILLSLISLFFVAGMFAQTTVKIYAIQGQGSTSPYKDSVVTTTGVVTAIYSSGTPLVQKGYYIQDSAKAWNGIYVYSSSPTVALGDNITVTGKVAEFLATTPAGLTNSQTEITSVTNVTVNSTGNAAPNPVVVTTLDANKEDYEGVLIKVQHANCTDWGTVAKTGHVTDGSGDILVYDKFIGTMTLAVGKNYDITGIVDIFKDVMELMPRDANDYTELASLYEVNTNGLTVYPNPTSDVINFNVNANRVQIINSVGQRVISAQNVNTMSVSNLPKGIYSVVIDTKDGRQVSKFVKE